MERSVPCNKWQIEPSIWLNKVGVAALLLILLLTDLDAIAVVYVMSLNNWVSDILS